MSACGARVSSPKRATSAQLERLANELMGSPHLSQRVGGFVHLARPALEELVPIENARCPIAP